MIRKPDIFDILQLNMSVMSDKLSSDYGKYFINYHENIRPTKCDPGGLDRVWDEQ